MQARKPIGALENTTRSFFCTKCNRIYGEYEVHECQR
jgi:hypothetical protein